MEEITGGVRADTVAVGIQALEDGVRKQSPIPLDDDGEEAHTAEITCIPDAVAADMERFLVPSHTCQDGREEAHVREVTHVQDTVAVYMERFLVSSRTCQDGGEEAHVREVTHVLDTVAVDMERFLIPSRTCQDGGEEAHVREVTHVLDTVAVDMERFLIPSRTCQDGGEEPHVREVTHVLETVAVDMERFLVSSRTCQDGGEEAHVREVTHVLDTVAVDMERFLVPSRTYQDGGEEAHVREGTHVLGTVAVDMERVEDCLGYDYDDREEAHISLKREDLNSNWVSSIKQKNRVEPKILKASSASKSCSIHRVPYWLPKDNWNAYRPQFISIGPYHYKKRKRQLRAMEEHKKRYLQDICSKKPERWLEDCLTTIKRLEKRARNCYSEVIPLDSDSFVEMMVLDGCFLIELFRKYWSENDVIFQLNWPRNAIYFDLILMENQIPFFILQHLSQKIEIDASERYPSLVESALNFLYLRDSTLVETITASHIRIRHLLHLVQVGHTLFPIQLKIPSEWVGIPCASRLKERGIKFKARDAGDAEVLNIKFDFDKGVIEIPRIQVWDQTKIEFLNLIAFEQCYPYCDRYITAYCYFMDCLINTAKDVEILSSEGIIEDALGSEKLVASHFNGMAGGTINLLDDFYLSDVCYEINRYSKRRLPKLKASLAHDYFNNPWAIISFLAALFLLLLAMTQTFFTSFPKFASGN